MITQRRYLQNPFPGVGLATAVLLFSLAACQPFSFHPSQQSLEERRANPEPASPAQPSAHNQKRATGTKFVAVTANPLATNAAMRVLSEGGNAVDAAIAAQMVLGLVEPQSSGIGGGGFIVYWDAAQQRLHSYDGRETAPVGVDQTLFSISSSRPLSWFDAVIGGRSVGVPGLLDMLHRAHQSSGVLPWARLFDDAISIAETGFLVSPRLNHLVSRVPKVDAREPLRQYLFDGGEPVAKGHRLANPDYASILRQLAQDGPDSFYRGEIAQRVVDVVREDQNAGGLSLEDMRSYRSVERQPACFAVLEHKLCGMGPPSSGPLTIMAILATMEHLLDQGLLDYGVPTNESADVAHAFIEATRLAFADRDTYMADSDFVDVPVDSLLNRSYLDSRAALIDMNWRMEGVSPGDFSLASAKRSRSTSPELNSTTHLSIVDKQGNVLSMTTSIETAFGSRLFVDGFILNNQLTDFSFVPEGVDTGLIANRVEPGKRPRSSMSPMIVFDGNEQPVLAIGSPGGTSIIAYVARVLYDHFAGDLSLEQAIEGRHIVAGSDARLEKGVSEVVVTELQKKGHAVKLSEQNSGIHAIRRTPDGWLGVADSRREGSVAAQ